ncbi:MAG TPA: hypothetical protein QGI07_09795 [Dehalococcoidia bacterium]|nr:hypothetical protein [Chloroflexota bacterium]MDP5876722.1 hypothetical protein [Dehalococcoidia bacterium]MDP6273758.1 hypothetical protein [Dehalococcoidia bacterium]MDP7160765.1 hypothetical protein [Dehalococcoidia bacterium]MDP7514009.1 hypothetical protein [Dehalococcoidia bacterium]
MTTLVTRSSAIAPPRPGSGPSRPEATPSFNDADEFSRAALDSVVSKRGDTLSISVVSEVEAIAISTRLELLLMTVGMGAGSVSARVAPSFMEHTYPAMHSLTSALDKSGMSGMWTAVGGRSIRLMESWQMFISVDAPSGKSMPGMPARPDTLLEVVTADRIPTEWFRTRVVPRASARGLTTVFYSSFSRPADGNESLFDRVRRSNLTKEWRDGVRRHFDTTEQTAIAAVS